MNVPHVLLNNGDIIFSLPSGTQYVTPRSFNYRRIKNSLPITMDDLAPLLVVPNCPDGVFYAYQLPNDVLIEQVSTNGTNYSTLCGSSLVRSHSTDLPCLGTYPSRESLVDDFPEYSL